MKGCGGIGIAAPADYRVKPGYPPRRQVTSPWSFAGCGDKLAISMPFRAADATDQLTDRRRLQNFGSKLAVLCAHALSVLLTTDDRYESPLVS